MYLTTKIQQTEQRHEADLSILRAMCYHCARLYNVGLYSVRQHYFATQKYLSYGQNFHECQDNENYQILLSDCGQQVLRLVDRDMQSFFRLLILKQSGRYSERVRLPRYKKSESLMICPIQGRSCRIQKNGMVAIGLTKEFREKYGIVDRRFLLTIPKHLRGIKDFKEIRIIPQFGGKQFSIEFIYEQPKTFQQASGNGYMSIDLGVTNFAACTVFSNGDARQFLIDGRRLKNINHYYNKKTAALKSEYDKQGIKDATSRMMKLTNGRNNRITDYFNKSVSMIIRECLANGVTTLVIGYNKEQKQDVNIGRVNNQNLQYIPYYRFREKLKYQCELHGISYCPQEESYTSKASALDGDYLPKFGEDGEHTFSGTRKHRGLYISSDGSVLNADINGSVNILRKYFKERKENWASQDSVRALVNTPCPRLSPWAQAHVL